MTPMLFVANANFPAKTLGEAIAAAKAAPERVALGSSTRGSIPNLTNELLAAKSGAKFQIVPFSSSAQGVQAVVGGEVPLFSDGVAAVIQLVRAGRLKALAAASDSVLPGLEGIPLAKDTVPGLTVYGWFAMVAPKGTPKEVVTRLNQEINEIIKDPEVLEKFQKLGTYPRSGTPESAQQFMKSEIELFSGVIKAAGIKPE
jgi:tripartite-type tricarboxylate transporter receptor subunit TctC